MRRRLITIRETKFYKSRLVPFSDGLLDVLRAYHRRRIGQLGAPRPEAAFFPTEAGGHYALQSIYPGWHALLRRAGLDADGCRPRIHDLRHSFATLRLATWYREGADVNAKLPLLTTYMGHAQVAATQVYLTMLPEMLQIVSDRFRQYGGALVVPMEGDGEPA